MELIKEREAFDQNTIKTESSRLKFIGVEGYDVYNCSIPFTRKGKKYIFGRVERREEWMRSWVRLFEETERDTFTLVPDSMIYQMEDPYIAVIHKQLILGGTHVRVQKEELDTYYGYFYKGRDLHNLYYFTTGPDYMKDIRLVEMADGRIGIFSRPRNEDILEKFGSESMIGFTVVEKLEDITAEVIENAAYLENLFQSGEWGGCNQAYLLDSGLIGVTGHICYLQEEVSTYLNIAFVLNPDTREVHNLHIIGTRKSFPDGAAKKASLVDCAFTGGITMREDGYADLYSGIGDCEEGRSVIPYPFEGYGEIVTPAGF